MSQEFIQFGVINNRRNVCPLRPLVRAQGIDLYAGEQVALSLAVQSEALRSAAWASRTQLVSLDLGVHIPLGTYILTLSPGDMHTH